HTLPVASHPLRHLSSFVIVHSHLRLPHPHPFPTRRSSDLCIKNAIHYLGSEPVVNPNSVLALVAATFSAALAVAAACRGRRSLATWCFSAGMLTFALESLFGGIWLAASIPQRAAFWETLTLVAKSFLPGIWLCFSL